MERIGVYPGAFDPITNGHTDIIDRATRLVDRLLIGVALNTGKSSMFDIEERLEMVRHEISARTGTNGTVIEVKPITSLLMHFAEQHFANIIVRGLRAVSDFDYEFQMVGMNARLNPSIETVFLMASESQQFIASRFVKEIALLGGDVSSFVSQNVAARTADRVKQRSQD